MACVVSHNINLFLVKFGVTEGMALHSRMLGHSEVGYSPVWSWQIIHSCLYNFASNLDISYSTAPEVLNCVRFKTNS